MKKIKNLSKTVLYTFFIIQFAVAPSFMPLIARAEDEAKVETTNEATESRIDSEEKAPTEAPIDVDKEVASDSNPDSSENSNSDSSNESLGEIIKEVVQDVTDAVLGDTEDETTLDNQAAVVEATGDGSIEICKVIINANNEVVVGDEFDGENFSIKLKNNDVLVQDFTFSAPLSNTIEFGANDEYVMQCQTKNNLPFGTYVYAKEDTEGSVNWEDTYTEGDMNNPLTGQSYAYGNDLDSNGVIVIDDESSENPYGSPHTSARVIVVNKFLSGDSCDAPAVYARINLTPLVGSNVLKNNFGYWNTGNGNMAPEIHVGSEVYNPGEWFLVYDPETGYVNDPFLTHSDPGFAGLAVQRLDGQLRVVLYGSHEQPEGQELTNREMANGFIEFSNDASTVSSDVTITNQIVDSQNRLEFDRHAGQGYTGNPIDWPTSDDISFTTNRSFFKFVVTVGNDGMYTTYSHTLPSGEDCGGGNDNHPPVISAPNKVCILPNVTEESFDFMAGVSTSDPDGDNVTVTYGHGIIFGVLGIYDIFYNATDSHVVAGAHTTVEIKADCGNGGGGDTDVCPNIPGNQTTVPSGKHLDSQGNCVDNGGGGGGGGSCDESSNLIQNASFENPTISNSNGWAIYENGTSGLVWSSAWQAGAGDGNTPKTELQKIYTAQDGTQYLELDSDFQGPGGLANDNASSKVSQTISTVSGQEYKISFYYSARPGRGAADSKLAVLVNGSQVGAIINDDGTGDTNTNWILATRIFTATSNSTVITFADMGVSNSYGMFVDNVRVNCHDDDGGDDDNPTCDEQITWARVVVTSFSNTGSGDVTDTIYLGSSSNTVANGEWFPLNMIDAGGIESYADVEGIAVRRKPGNRIALELFGRHPGPNSANGSEHISGYIEFFNGTPTAQIGAANGSGAKLEFTNNSLPADSIFVSSDKSYFNLHVNTGADRFDTLYAFVIDEDCDGGDDDNHAPIINLADVCIETSATTFNFTNGVTTSDPDGDNVTLTYVVNPNPIVFGQTGSYTITYTATDGEDSTTVTIDLAIEQDCDNIGDDDEDPTLSFATFGCIVVGTSGFNFLTGVTASDDEGAGNVTITNNGATVVNFGVAGAYVVEYVATDSDGNVSTYNRTIVISENCGGTGGGDDDAPTINLPTDACRTTGSTTNFDFLAGVSAEDFTGDAIALNLTDNVLNEELVNFDAQGDYIVTYTVTDAFGTTTVDRTIIVRDDCNNGGGGGGGGDNDDDDDNGSGGGGSSSRRSRNGEVLGAETSCAQFTEYHDTGSTQSEVEAIQTFLNEYMDAGLTVSGTYDWATTNAIHQFQAKHWNEIIKPWLGGPSEISPNTTGRTRQTTMSAMNFIIGCPNAALYLEDPQIMYEITSIDNQNPFADEQVEKVIMLLNTAHGVVTE